ncbi:MAG: NB-ARC domain-containing protein [Pseudomonadota bacterium]
MLKNSNFADNRLETATKKGDYEYWLTQEDIADIARLEYLDFRQGNEEDSFRAFEIIGSPEQLRTQLLTFITRAEHVNNARLTLIINLAQQHWVTLVITCHNKNYAGHYIDTLGEWLPENYQASLENILIPFVNLSGYFPRQIDGFNCGLWALENAEDLTRMVDERKGPHWIVHQLQRYRSPAHFSERRRLLSSKLSSDPIRQQRLSQTDQPIPIKETDNQLPRPISPSTTVDEPNPKKIKLVTETEKVKEKQDLFVKFFIQAFATRLGTYNLIAKGDRLTTEALKTELKTGFVGALWGVTIMQNLVGSIPSVVASLRNVSAKYFTPKKKAQKLTKAFSEIKSSDLSEFLAEAAIEIFQSYEQQFMRISDKAGHHTALDKLADDAAGRTLNYLDENLTPTTAISSEIIAFGILWGKSEIYFDPSLKKTRLRFTGNHIQDEEGHSFSTASLFEKVGVIIKSKSPDTFYKKNIPQSTHYGYRRPLSWETDAQGALKASEQSKYIPENPSDLIPYDYQLNSINVQQEAIQVLERISISKVITSKTPPKNIIFNLRHPLKNFSGRSQPLNALHQLLGSGSKPTVVTQMAQLSLNPADGLGQPLQEEAQAAVSGLGGIGKTQLALQYAKQHAANYDYNVLWIDSEKKIDIINSFKKLAIKLSIDLNDAYSSEKESGQLIEEVYDYFARAKSLFIFDNVENAKEIKDILPKASSGNKPTVLITSRYSNWKNIATPLHLGVFTEIEARVFIKTELSIMGNAENAQITELANLLQSLPLALQQALAYINSEKILDSNFSIQNYIERFKQKQRSQELLDFDLSQHSNDPYSKTILTTWEITLEKIKQDKIIGAKAIETIQIMAYLYPDNILNSMFFQLPNNVRLSPAIHLLKAYSLINEGSEPHISTIHRLVQKVLRIKLESNHSEFEKIVQNIIYLTGDFTQNKEVMSHYFTFLLHMLEHKELTQTLDLQVNHRKILESLTYYEKDKNLLNDLFDFAYTTLSRENYLQFIGEALVIYMRYPFIIALSNILDYVDEKINQGLISLDEVKTILDFKYTITRENYKEVRFSSVPFKRAVQFNAIILVFAFEHKHFSKDPTRICQVKKKRSINTFCALSEDERLIERPLDSQQIKVHIEKVRLVANLANLALLSKDTLSALIQGDFESVAINFALLSSSRVLGKISNNLLIKGGEQLAYADEILQKELDYDAKLAASLFTDKEILLAGKRRFLGSAMKAAAPFVARSTTLFFIYNLGKGLSSNQTDFLDNLSNAAIVGLDVGEAGIEAIEYLGYMAGISEFTGPIGEGLGFLIIAGIQLYHVEKELKAIEKWVHLSNREKFVEGIRAFFNFQPSEYLEAKANNDQLVNKAIAFLKLHPEIQRYVFSAWLPAATLAKKNFVFLDRKRNLTLLTDDIPQEPQEGHLFCLAGARSPSHSKDGPWIEKQLESFIETELESLLGLEERTLYLCINTIGVEYNVNRTGNATLIALQGDATVIGAHSDTLFLINNGNQNYWAGDADDLFILQGTHITGKLQGGLGVNVVKFSDYQPNAESVLLDSQGFLCGKNTTANSREDFFVRSLQLSNSTQLDDRFSMVGITVDTSAGKNVVKLDYISIPEKSSKNLNITVKPNTVVYLLPGNSTDNIVIYKVPADQIGSAYMQSPFNDETIYQFEEFCIEGLRLSNITQLHGRKNKQDTIFTIEGITVVDTYAGENADKPDTIYITEKSSKNLNIVLRPNTIVHSLPRNTTDNRVIYKIPVDQIGNAYVQLPFNDETIHQFYFESPLDDLEALSIKNNTISLLLNYPDGCFNLTIQNTDALPPTSNAAIAKPFFILSASYLFNKNLEVKLVNEKTLYSQWHGNHSVDEIIQVVAPIAHRIDKAMLIQTPQNQTITMGSRQQEILSTDGLVVNHLVGNGEDTVYVIQIPKNRTDPFPLNDISLYNLENNTLVTTTTETLDLREVLKKAQDLCSAQSILPTIEENKEDLILTLYTNYYFSVSTGCSPLALSSYPLLKILLKNALNNYWYQDLDIILHDHPMNIIYDEDNWKLAPIPLAFTGNKNIIVITDMDIKKHFEFFILKNAGQYDFIRHNDTDLLLTNMFYNATEAELYTVLFSKFFQDSLFKEKVLSLSVTFLDASLTLNEHTQEINNAMDFYPLIKAYFNTSQVFLNQSGLFFTDVTRQPTSRQRRDVATPAPISSASSKITPDIYNLFTYLPFKMLELASFTLTRFNFANVNQLEEKSVARKKTKRSITLAKEKLNPPVYCNKNNIFTKENCWKNESPLGLLGYCSNPKQGIAWFIKTTGETTTPKLSWFAITNNGITTNTSTHYLNTQASRLSLQADHLHFSPQDGCHQVINLDKMSNTTLTTLFPYLPLEGKQWLLAEWRHEKNRQDKLLQDEIALSLFKQQSLQVGLNYLGNAGLLHTFIGDYFQTFHLKPDWREHDPSYFLARWLSAIQQLRLGGTKQTSTVAAALLETALLHPKIQAGYSFLWPNTKIRYKKQALRFCADLLQWGNLNFALLPSLLELLFADYLPIESITWGLRAALSFYSINNDPSYYYLGIALFLLPQLPLLLEHLGIPVTAYASKTLEKLTQLLIFQSLLEQLKPTPDPSRLAQRSIELQAAEQRVAKGSARAAIAIKPLVSFFKPPSVNKQDIHHPENEKHASKSTYAS